MACTICYIYYEFFIMHTYVNVKVQVVYECFQEFTVLLCTYQSCDQDIFVVQVRSNLAPPPLIRLPKALSTAVSVKNQADPASVQVCRPSSCGESRADYGAGSQEEEQLNFQVIYYSIYLIITYY